MKYSCDHCSYETDKKANYLRHLNRKFRCNKGGKNVDDVGKNVDDVRRNVDDVRRNVDDVGKNVDDVGKNVDDVGKNVDDDIIACTKCNKQFKSKKGLANHIDICEGLSKLQCETCLKFFSSASSKSHHKRYVLCYPPPPPPSSLPDIEPSEMNILITKESDTTTIPHQQPTSLTNTTTTNSNNNQITTNTHSNNTVNNVNNIIQYNAFGDEGIEQLGKFLSGRKDDSRIIERMRQLGKKKIYGIREIQNDIFFNPDNPEGFSIIKPEKYGSSVRVRNSEGEFEYMEFEDVRDPLLNYIEKYIDIYNKTRNKYNVKFRDPKERRILQNFFKIMNDNLEIYLTEDLKEDLNIKDNTSEEDKYKQFDRVSLDNIHVQTKKYYKCKKGEFVLKDNKC